MSGPDPLLCVVGALAELRGLHSGDPAAADANEAIRSAANTLEFFWLPALASGGRPTWSVDPRRTKTVDLDASEQPRQPDGR